MRNYKTINVTKETYERLVKLGKFGDTMDSIIVSILPQVSSIALV